MKKIKKLFLPVVLLALCMCCIIPFAGCKDDGEWIEVLSVSYKFETGEGRSFGSTVKWDMKRTYVIKEAYDLAAEDMKLCFENFNDYHELFPDTDSDMSTDRNEYFNNLNKFINKTYYINVRERSYGYGNEWYFKETWGNYTVNYVKIQLLENNTLKIKYKNEVLEVQPLLYEITYFEN
ncbi:MAG: hypothetical protein K2K60_03060 [Clostridia bacterium]|nr:hypothetical protein [Clostridia bacterium]